jgi:uncharacterized repeat protein (TIGR03803 family)
VFEVSPPKQTGGASTEKVLHRFAGIASGKQYGDGGNPNGGLVLDNKGNIYGTTYVGGYNCPHSSNQGCGTAFRVAPPAKKDGTRAERILHEFHRTDSDGGNPMAGLTLDAKGELYGTTLNGGPGLYGTVFRLRPPRGKSGVWDQVLLWSFNDNDNRGIDPMAGVVFDSGGSLYGTTNGGSPNSRRGNVFRLTPAPGGHWKFDVIYSFADSPDGAYPAAGVILDVQGNLYSTTQYGGTGTECGFQGCGTAFEVGR